MTQTAAARGRAPAQSKVHRSLAQCDHWEQSTIWRDRDLQRKTTTRPAAGAKGNCDVPGRLRGRNVAWNEAVTLCFDQILVLCVIVFCFFFSIFIPVLKFHPLYFDPFPVLRPYRLAFEGQEGSHHYSNTREVSSTHSSPYKTLPRPPRDPRSMPPTPVLTRNAYSSSQLRSDLLSEPLLTF